MAKFARADIRKIIGEGCTEEMETQLVAMHMGVVDSLKDDLAAVKAEAAKTSELQKKIEELEAEKKNGEDWKAKFEKEHSDFDEYKKTIEEEKAVGVKKDAYRAILKELKIADKLSDVIIAGTDFSGMKVGKDGKLENADKLTESIKTEWKDYIPVTTKSGADVETPPASTGTKMTLEQIDAIEDDAARQKAMLDNKELFGIV